MTQRVMTKVPISEPALMTWTSLNDFMWDANEAECQALLDIELKGRNRKKFVSRIHSRLNRVRAQRERKELACV